MRVGVCVGGMLGGGRGVEGWGGEGGARCRVRNAYTAGRSVTHVSDLPQPATQYDTPHHMIHCHAVPHTTHPCSASAQSILRRWLIRVLPV